MGKEKIFFDKTFCAGQHNLEIHFQFRSTITILKSIFNFEIRNSLNLEIHFRENKKMRLFTIVSFYNMRTLASFSVFDKVMPNIT